MFGSNAYEGTRKKAEGGDGSLVKTVAGGVGAEGGAIADVSHGLQSGNMQQAAQGAAGAYTGGAAYKDMYDESGLHKQGSNAWNTATGNVRDFANNAWDKLQGMWDKANNNVGVPGGLPGMDGGIPQVGGGGGGGPGGMGSFAGYHPGTIGMGGVPANDPFRMAQVAYLHQAMDPNGASIAANQLKTGQQAALAASLAQANSARGGANPMLARAALQNNAQQGGQMAMDAANQRVAEQMQAMQVAGQGRSGDVALQNAALQQQQINNQASTAQAQIAQQYAAQGLDAQKANQQAALDIARMKQQGTLGMYGLQMQAGQNQNNLLGQGLGAAGSVIAALFS